jgi:hypothetical protein
LPELIRAPVIARLCVWEAARRVRVVGQMKECNLKVWEREHRAERGRGHAYGAPSRADRCNRCCGHATWGSSSHLEGRAAARRRPNATAAILALLQVDFSKLSTLSSLSNFAHQMINSTSQHFDITCSHQTSPDTQHQQKVCGTTLLRAARASLCSRSLPLVLV